MGRHREKNSQIAGFALLLCAVRFMGFVPDDLASAPQEQMHRRIGRSIHPFRRILQLELLDARYEW
jgi:hypothetical protein